MTDRTAHARLIKLGADILNQRRWGDSIFAEDAKRQDDALAALGYEAGQIAKLLATPAPAQPEGAQEDEPAGEAELMPKTAGVFTKAMFDANEVPPGTKLYLHPSRSAGAAAPVEGAASDICKLVYALCEDIDVKARGSASNFDAGMRTAARRIAKEVGAAAPKEKP